MAKQSTILFPTDFSAPAAQALERVVDFARKLGARVVLLHVIPQSAYPLRGLATAAGMPNLREEMKKVADQELAALRAKIPADVACETKVREGVPHEQVIACAQEIAADLVAIATQGHTGLKHVLLGSTAERVVRLSPIPVLTFRAAQA